MQQQDHFQERLELVRKRFASSLEGKINDTFAELPSLGGESSMSAFEALSNAYRRIHGICGVGKAVGFPETGRAAKDVEDVLVAAYRGQRGLAAGELARLEKTLGALAIVAHAELHSAPMPTTAQQDG